MFVHDERVIFYRDYDSSYANNHSALMLRVTIWKQLPPVLFRIRKYQCILITTARRVCLTHTLLTTWALKYSYRVNNRSITIREKRTNKISPEQTINKIENVSHLTKYTRPNVTYNKSTDKTLTTHSLIVIIIIDQNQTHHTETGHRLSTMLS